MRTGVGSVMLHPLHYCLDDLLFSGQERPLKRSARWERMEWGGEPTYLVHHTWRLFHELRYRFCPKSRKTDSLFYHQQASTLLYRRHKRPRIKGIQL
jgi:hypothetical protein